MNTNNDWDAAAAAHPLPQWTDCDVFCIHDYAGAGPAPCGWRGRMREVRWDATGTRLVCPRCGCPTLLRLPLD